MKVVYLRQPVKEPMQLVVTHMIEVQHTDVCLVRVRNDALVGNQVTPVVRLQQSV